jgi:hypothetical protein
MGKDDLNEGHGFSRAVDGCMKAGRLQPLRSGLLLGGLWVDWSIGKDVPQGLKPSMAGGFMARLNPCPSFRFVSWHAKPVPFVQVFLTGSAVEGRALSNVP